MASNVVVALLVIVVGLTMVTASVFNGSYSIALGKTNSGSDSGSSSGSNSNNNEKSSGDSGSNSGSNDNNAGNSPGSGQPSTLKEATPTEPKGVDTTPPTEEAKKSDEKPTCLIPEGCGPNPHQPIAPPLTPPTTPKQGGGPDHECLFKPELPKCKSDNGKCPDGFSQNEDGNCFPNHDRCPKGFHSHEDDETGRCVSDKVPCEPGFIRDPNFPTCNSKTSVCRDHPQTKGCNSDNEDAGRCLSGRELRKDFCIRVILTIHHSGSSNSNSNNPNHSVSDKCFSQIKIAWLAKIQRGQNSQVDSIINNCLGIK